MIISFNSLGPSDAICRWRSWSTLVQVMACCLTAPSHYLNQCWLIISKVLWHSSEDIIIRQFEETNQQSKTENYIFKVTLRSPRGQWVKECQNMTSVIVIFDMMLYQCQSAQWWLNQKGKIQISLWTHKGHWAYLTLMGTHGASIVYTVMLF